MLTPADVERRHAARDYGQAQQAPPPEHKTLRAIAAGLMKNPGAKYVSAHTPIHLGNGHVLIREVVWTMNLPSKETR